MLRFHNKIGGGPLPSGIAVMAPCTSTYVNPFDRDCLHDMSMQHWQRNRSLSSWAHISLAHVRVMLEAWRSVHAAISNLRLWRAGLAAALVERCKTCTCLAPPRWPWTRRKPARSATTRAVRTISKQQHCAIKSCESSRASLCVAVCARLSPLLCSFAHMLVSVAARVRRLLASLAGPPRALASAYSLARHSSLIYALDHRA